MPKYDYPLHPGQTHAQPLYAQIPLEEYETMMRENKRLKDVIHELQVNLEGAKATAYAESVDAGMREHRLKRALYKACENWADAEVFSRVKSVNDDNTEANKWAVMRNKCRAMAEKFK